MEGLLLMLLLGIFPNPVYLTGLTLARGGGMALGSDVINSIF
jgi:hypothetical protein